MNITFLSGPFASESSLEMKLRELLASPKYESAIFCVAWAKQSGLFQLRKALGDFTRVSALRAVVGIDQDGADVEGLEMLMRLTTDVTIVHNPTGGTFHPKIYVFEGPQYAYAIVGSSNLTNGGLRTNYEASLGVDLLLDNPTDVVLLRQITDYIDKVAGDATSAVLNESLLLRLVSSGMVKPAAKGRARVRKRIGYAPDLPFSPSEFPIRSNSISKTDPISVAPTNDVIADPNQEAHPVYRWFRSLRAPSNSGEPNSGSNTTGAVRLAKAGHPIDQTTWFRDKLFASLNWEVRKQAWPTREWADVDMHVIDNGTSLGIRTFTISHDPLREAGQNNFTTDIKWGSFTAELGNIVAEAPWLVLEYDANDTYTMRFERTQPVAGVL